MMQSNSERSPLLRLPAELRNFIFHEVLVPKKGIDKDIFHLANGHMTPPVLRTCQQLRNECTGIWCDNTTFHFSDPALCIKLLSRLRDDQIELIKEMRYDTSEVCTSSTSWRTAFRQLPGLDEDTKLESLREELVKRGINLRIGVLKARIVISCRPSWTSDPLSAALDAVKQGA